MLKTVKILVADDHSVVRTGLKALLERQKHFKIIAEAKTGKEAIEKAQVSRPHVAVLDIRMQGVSGIEACRQIVDSVEGCKVIMLTAYADDDLLFAAIQAGAAGYVLKRVGGNELIHAIERISKGDGFLDSSLVTVAFSAVHKASEAQRIAKFAHLTAQEISVLSLVTKGMTNRQIAIKLYLGEGTVRNYVSSVLSKLVVANRAEAAAFAVKHNIDAIIEAY